MQLSQDQILQLAPDPASAKAGMQLANGAKWVLKAAHEKALWGDCQGSGKVPYRTAIDLTNIAFKCSCPSRKFPCKHGLALFLLYTANPGSFTVETELPEAVAEWIAKRAGKAEAKEQKEAKPVDDAAQKKRADARDKKVAGGVAELRIWLKDTVRSGIAQVQQNPYHFNQTITARMVDSQAPGLAGKLRKLNGINFYADGWQKALLKQLSKTYLLTDGYLNRETLEASIRTELDIQMGKTIPKEEVLAGEAIADRWLVLSRSMEEEANLTVEYVWLYGSQTRRFALILNFYAANQIADRILAEGSTVTGELAYYPSLYPMRALFKSQQTVHGGLPPVADCTPLADVYNRVADILSVNPFVERIPFILGDVRIRKQEGIWWATDAGDRAVRLANTDTQGWMLLAISQGRAFNGFAVYENETFTLHSLWADDQYHVIE